MMMNLVMVGFGGFVGAIARYGVSSLVQRHMGGSFPAATMIVNLAGCFFIGVLMVLIQERAVWGENARLLLSIGFLGSLTTFSTFGSETLELMMAANYRLALLSVMGNLVLGIGAVALGRTAAAFIK